MSALLELPWTTVSVIVWTKQQPNQVEGQKRLNEQSSESSTTLCYQAAIHKHAHCQELPRVV